MKGKPIVSFDFDDKGLRLLNELLSTCLDERLFDEKSEMTPFIKDIITAIKLYRDNENNAII